MTDEAIESIKEGSWQKVQDLPVGKKKKKWKWRLGKWLQCWWENIYLFYLKKVAGTRSARKGGGGIENEYWKNNCNVDEKISFILSSDSETAVLRKIFFENLIHQIQN